MKNRHRTIVALLTVIAVLLGLNLVVGCKSYGESMGQAGGAVDSAIDVLLRGWSNPTSEYPAQYDGWNGQLQIHGIGVQFHTGLWYKQVLYQQIASVKSREGFLRRDRLLIKSAEETYVFSFPRNCNVTEIARDIAQRSAMTLVPIDDR